MNEVDKLLPTIQTTVASIRENECIGCTKCIVACPFDTIIGGAKQMHSIITQECTGCELCVPACPVDCIDMIPAPRFSEAASARRQQAYVRYDDRLQRLENEKNQKETELTQRIKKKYIADAIARVKAKKLKI